MVSKAQFPAEQSAAGEFVRQDDAFRDWLSADGSTPHTFTAGRCLIDVNQQPGIADTVNFDHIKPHYYFTHDDINPTRIVPVGPQLDFTRAHGRERL